MKFFFSLVAVPAFLIGCFDQTQPDPNQSIVKVNDKTLSSKEFADDLSRRMKNMNSFSAKTPANVRQVKFNVVQAFIHRAIVESYAEKNSLSVSEEELSASIDKVRSQYPDDLEFRRSLAKEGISHEEWKAQLRQSLLEQKVISKVTENTLAPTDQEIDSYFKEHQKEFSAKPQVRLRQILVDKKDDAERLLKEVRSTKDLPKLARKFSIAPEANKGGDIGWIEKGVLDVFDKIFSQPKSTYSPVLKSSFGYHIVEVTDRRTESQLNMDQIRDRIRRDLRSDRSQALYAGWLEEQIRRSKVSTNDKVIESIFVQTTNEP